MGKDKNEQVTALYMLVPFTVILLDKFQGKIK